MRVRGLKHILVECSVHKLKSHPMRVRGLKLNKEQYKQVVKMVAPHAGAWIETYITTQGNVRGGVVAPHAGAWIETELVNRVG